MFFHLADRIAPTEDMSMLINKNHWPGHLMSHKRKMQIDGLWLYRPFEGAGVSINELGLRTPSPSLKKAGEWRVAVTGGSSAWGWRVPDADTIPVRLQRALHRRGQLNVTVYNFAIDGITIGDELAVVKRFRDLYAIDQVIFYTGANDATTRYLDEIAPARSSSSLLIGANAFELIKVVARLKAVLTEPPLSLLANLDTQIIPKVAQSNSLRDGVVAAVQYCRQSAIHCNFVLQPMLLLREQPRGAEIRLAQTLSRLYPRYREVVVAIYRSVAKDALVYDQADMFAQSGSPYFFDVVHVNENGNKFAAERLVEIVSALLPIPKEK